MAPASIVDSFAEALKQLKTETRIKFQMLKELNQASLGDLAAIYADLNKHLAELKMMPAPMRADEQRRGTASGRRGAQAPLPPARRRRRRPRST